MTEEVKQAEVQAEASSEQVNQAPVIEKEDPRKSSDHNWNQARMVMGAQSTKIKELENRLAELQQQKENVEEKEEAFDPDEYATNKHVERVAEKKLSKHTKELHKKIETLEKQLNDTVQTKLENETKSKFQDYDYVIANFAIPMIEKDNSLAIAIKASPNPYLTAYRLAKSSDEYEAEMTKQKPNPKAEKIIKNSDRPLSSNATAGTLKNQAEAFSNLKPDEVWELSQKYARKA